MSDSTERTAANVEIAGTRLAAWCVAHYRLAGGRIVEIEQHDCYEQPAPPGDAARLARSSRAAS